MVMENWEMIMVSATLIPIVNTMVDIPFITWLVDIEAPFIIGSSETTWSEI